MPATRPERSRDDKADDIIEAALALFVERGYDATTMSAVAKQVGVASNVVYWYFASKDHLFVAAMDRLVDAVIADALAAARPDDGGPIDIETGLVAVVERLSLGSALIATTHERARQSPVVAEFHERVHARYAEVLTAAVKERGVPAAERRLVVDALSTAVEGLVMHGATPAESRKMIRFLTRRLVVSPSPA